MNVFKNSASANAAEPSVSVNCDFKASISDRVDFRSQNIQYFEDYTSDDIALIARSYETGFNDSKKGMFLIFPKDIQSGSYKPSDENFPFKKFEYYENASNGNYTTSYTYEAQSGTVNVEVISNDSKALRYLIKFDFKGKDNRTEELRVQGEAQINIFTRAL